MVLLMNLDTLGKAHDESAQQAISEMLSDAWLTVTDAEHNGVTSIMPIILNSSGRGTFTMPLNQLRSQMQTMQAPVATARAGRAG